jgi:protease-4
MTLETDLLIERRRLKRRLSLWRGALLLGVIALVAALAGRPDAAGELLGGAHVARLTLSGTIIEDRRLLREVERATRDPGLRALVVAIDSPGGSVAGGEAFHSAIQRVREAGKPVVAVMGGTAASAGYMVALPAQRIFAREATLTGSIGVILQTFEVSELMGRLGLRAETLASGPLKDQPSPFRPLTEEGRAALEEVIQDLQSQFVGRVATGRAMPEARVRELADGRVMSGRQALGLGLIDAIGGEREARAWLAEAHGIPADLRIRDLDARSTAERALSAGVGVVWQGAASVLRAEGWMPGQISPR